MSRTSVYHEDSNLGPVYDGRLVRRLWGYISPHRRLLYFSWALLLLVTGLGLLRPLLSKVAIDRYILPGDGAGLKIIVAVYFAVLLLEFIFENSRYYLMGITGQRATYELRRDIFDHLERMPMSFFDKNPVGRLVTRATSDVETLNELFTSGVVTVVGDLIKVIAIMGIMIALSPKLSAVTFLVLPVLVLTTALLRVYIRDAYRAIRTRIAHMNTFLNEHLSGMPVVQMLVQEKKSREEFASINAEHLGAQLRSVRYESVLSAVVELLSALAIAAIIWYGGGGMIRDAISFGTLWAFISYISRFFEPLQDLSTKYTILQAAMASSEKIFNLLDTPAEFASVTPAGGDLRLQGEIEFDSVGFAYDSGEPVLEDLSFRIEPGEKVAIVGATGAGKTTIFKLISRFYDPGSGSIRIDGRPIADYDRVALRRSIGLVLQEVFLFSGDVGANIAMANREISSEKLAAAAQAVNAHGFIEKLSDGYDTRIQEWGRNLSSGQRQLLSFARAFAYNPDILLLDEATSAVDTETEMLIQDALKQLIAGRTALVIAHRLSTIRFVDRILVVHRGRLVESGTHQSLLAKGGIYRKLYDLQFREGTAAI